MHKAIHEEAFQALLLEAFFSACDMNDNSTSYQYGLSGSLA
jgi:hypothetical protein